MCGFSPGFRMASWQGTAYSRVRIQVCERRLTSHVTYNSKQINIGAWNIQGVKNNTLGNKLKTDEVFKLVNNFDIIGISETHSSCDGDFVIPGYELLASVCRNKHTNAKKQSGGVAVLAKLSINKGLKFIPSPNLPDSVIWIKLDKQFFSFSIDVYCAFVYFSPEHSTYTQRENPDYFNKFENDLAHFKNKGLTIYAGDMNARTGTLQETCNIVEAYDNKHAPDKDFINNVAWAGKRFNQDSTTNVYGKSLIELCNVTNMVLLNGRTLGDTCGNFTCHQYNGSSCVDYVVADYSLLKSVNSFRIHDSLPCISDHSPIGFSMCGNFTHVKTTKYTGNRIVLKPLPKTYLWDKDAEDNFKNALSQPDIQTSLNSIENTESNTVDDLVNRLLASLSNLLTGPSRPKKYETHIIRVNINGLIMTVRS